MTKVIVDHGIEDKSNISDKVKGSIDIQKQSNVAFLFLLAEVIRRNMDYNYDKESISNLEERIDCLTTQSEKEIEFRIKCYGAFIGQCFVDSLKAEWIHKNGEQWLIQVGDVATINPFQLISKKLRRDAKESKEDRSIIELFELIETELNDESPLDKR
jgi:hypothetical protein